ncbi:MAG: hypothetical protein JWN22_7 [Nocardioides sp.]|nr:hypothetical protein [Nocardioides sp.]
MASRVRSTATWGAVLLVAALVPLLGPAAPTQAAGGCTSEVAPPPSIPPDFGCDDTTPPDTEITGMSPTPNAAGWTRRNEMAFTFHEVVVDGDTGPWSFMCKLTGPGQDAGFQPCTSGQKYTALADASATPYVFSVYAVDTSDSGITYAGNPLITTDDEDPAKPDDDSASPATATWKQDTVVPNAFIFGGPSDGSGSPVTTQPQVTYAIDASEGGVTYRCQLDGRDVPCDRGDITLRNLTGGNRVFAVKVTDAAGNEDNSAATEQFTVPYDLRSAKGWKRVDLKGAFADQVLQTTTKGARIRFKAHNVREVRFLAPAGTGLGKLRVQLGDGAWHTYNLAKGKTTASRSYRVPNSTLFSGTVTVEALSAGKPVRIDALVFPPG